MTVIRWLGQACFLILTVGGAHVLIDPPNPQVGYHLTAHSIPADLVLVSHSHPDHSYTAAAASTERGAPKVIGPIPRPTPPYTDSHGDATYSFGVPGLPADKVTATRIFAYHDNVQGKQRGTDTITVLQTGGLRICHMGDIGQLTLSQPQIKAIGRVDVLMIPVGGFYTVDGIQAAALVDELHPRVIIPMHYRTAALNADLKAKLAPPDEFLSAMAGKATVVRVKARDLRLSASTLPATPTIYLLPYAGNATSTSRGHVITPKGRRGQPHHRRTGPGGPPRHAPKASPKRRGR